MIIPKKERKTFKTDQKNYSQSPHQNNTQFSNAQNQNYRRSTSKHLRQLNQVQQPVIDNRKISEPQLSLIHCESTDVKSDTENTLKNNMLQIKMNMNHNLNRIIPKLKFLVQIVKNQITINKQQNTLHM